MSEAFKRKCRKVAEATGVEIVHLEDLAAEDGQYEDDGCLHIHKGGVWACFGIGQDLPGAEQNERIRAVMTALGMKKRINDRVLVEDWDDDDEEECPYCGQPM